MMMGNIRVTGIQATATSMNKQSHSRISVRIAARRSKRPSIQLGFIHRPREFIRTFKQSTFSILFNLGGLLAGLVMVLFFDVVSAVSWGLLVFPGILSIRGVLGGIFSGRLSSGLHTGSISPSLTKNTRDFNLLWQALIVMTLQSSLLLSTFALVVGILFAGVTFADVLLMVVVITATMTLSLALVAPITATVSFVSYRHGFDPDVIVYPIVSTVADITVTLVYVTVLTICFLGFIGVILAILPAVILLIVVTRLASMNAHEPEFMRTLRESLLTLVLVTTIVSVSGLALQSVNEIIGRRPEVYIVYPALIDTMGDVGSIVGSTATTKIALGSLDPSPSSIGGHLTEIFAAVSSGLVLCTLFVVIVNALQSLRLPGLLRLGAVLYATTSVAALSMSIIAFLTAAMTQRRGWNPDNFVIPIESSMADAVTSIMLLLFLVLLSY